MNIHLPAILGFTRGTRVLTHPHMSKLSSATDIPQVMGAGPEGEPPEHGCESKLCRGRPPVFSILKTREKPRRNYGEDLYNLRSNEEENNTPEIGNLIFRHIRLGVSAWFCHNSEIQFAWFMVSKRSMARFVLYTFGLLWKQSFKLLPRVSVGLSLGGQGGALILTSLWTHQLTSLPVARYDNVCSSMFGVLQQPKCGDDMWWRGADLFHENAKRTFPEELPMGEQRIECVWCGIVFIIPWSLVKDIKRQL